MKHIKRKTLLNEEIEKKITEKLELKEIDENALKGINFKEVRGKQALLVMDTGEKLYTFFHNDNGKGCPIPIANPVLVYFNMAQALLRDIHSCREKLLGQFRKKDAVNEDSLRLFYQFFGQTSTYVTMLMTAIEAFVNQKIDIEYKYEKADGNKCIQLYNHDQIQRWIPLKEKIDMILNKKFSKNFSTRHRSKQDLIEKLKELRDLIVHTKSNKNNESYIELYSKSINFRFIDTIEAVKDFINFYEPALIEPCPCGIDT